MSFDAKEIARAFLARMEKVYNECKVDELVDLYTPDAKMMPPGKPIVVGHKAIREHCQESIEKYCGGANVHKMALEETLELGDDCILVRSKSDYLIGDKLVYEAK